MNLETIAHRCGVSRSTVSRVINNSPNVRPEVRERVLQVLKETNFQPNLAARSLAAGATHILGLVIPIGVSHLFVDPYMPLLIQGISAECNARDYSVMLWLADPEYERRMIAQILHSGLIDGVIVSSQLVGDPLIDALVDHHFPFVVVGRVATPRPVYSVDVDNIAGACRAAEHLLSLGRSRLATITGPSGSPASADRLEGYYEALRRNGLDMHPEWVDAGNFTQEGGYEAMRRLLEHQPDAVFAASDAMAQGALRAITEAGLRVPQDVALAGFDDMPFAAHMNPPLTTIHQPIELMGSMAVNLLLERLHAPDADQPERVLLPTELIVRESSRG